MHQNCYLCVAYWATVAFRPFMLHGATPADTFFAGPLHMSFSEKFQRVTAALDS